MPDSMDATPLFFIHVMKTAGTSVTAALRDALPADQIYPNPADDGDLLAAMVNIEALVGLSPERTARTRLYAGHFPFAATQMLPFETLSITVLREPVARVVSHLRQLQQSGGAFRTFAKTLDGVEQPTFEQVYADPFLHDRFFRNHQCRVFGMTLADEPRSYVMPLRMDDDRLEIAKQQIGEIDVLGVTEEFGRFCDEVERRCGIPLDGGRQRNASPTGGEQPSDSLLNRITEDNELDVALYEHATTLVAARQKGAEPS